MALYMKYFVLKPESKTKDDAYAFASRQAMRTFADCCKDSQLAESLKKWAQSEDERCAELVDAEFSEEQNDSLP